MNVLFLFLMVTILVLSGCSSAPADRTCESMNGVSQMVMDSCPEGTEPVRAMDSCKSCHCCVPEGTFGTASGQ